MSTIQLANNSTPLAQWVDELFNKIFFQPDDTLATETFNEFVSPDLFARINHSQLSHDQFLEALKQARGKESMSVQASDEVHVWEAPDGSGAGCVAQLVRFTLTDKATGVENKALNLTLANVQVREGKRMLVELTEVAN